MNSSFFSSIGARVSIAIGTTLLLLQAVNLYSAAKEERTLTIESEVHAARNLILMAESVRQNMEQKWELGLFSPETLKNLSYDSPEEKKQKILASVPVVAAWESAKAKAKEGGFEFRTPRKGARNPDNEPDFIEQEALDYFASNRNAVEHHVIDEEMNAIRYFRPVRLGEVCMNCHGDPANAEALWGSTDGRDITGFKMDNKKIGDLHGAFEIIRPLDEADATIRDAIVIGVIETLIGLIIAMAVIQFAISRMISRPVSQALDSIARAEQDNDLTMKLSEDGKGEIAEMSKAFNRFTQRIRGFMGEVVKASSELASSSDHLSEITQTTSTAMRDQQVETQQVATAMNQMTATVAEVAQSAASAAQAANDATAETRSGEAVVSASRDNTQQLANEVSAASDVIKQLENDSDAIGSILDVIKGIAEQTNLLALNAAIEAARAGEQGRGFAVVADEVRTLAQRTQQSTSEIQAMIERLQTGAENAVNTMERGRAKASESVEQANKAGEALSAIATAIETINGMNTQIATASEEQTSVAEEVNRNIININQVSETTAESANQLSVATDQLKGLALQLQDLVSKFRV